MTPEAAAPFFAGWVGAHVLLLALVVVLVVFKKFGMSR